MLHTHIDSKCVCWGLLQHAAKQHKNGPHVDPHGRACTKHNTHACHDKPGVPKCDPLDQLAPDESGNNWALRQVKHTMTSDRETHT